MVSNRTLKIFDDPEKLAFDAARYIAGLLDEGHSSENKFSMALSGGSTPTRLYEILSEEPFRSTVNWERVEFFWVDERCVPPSEKGSNYWLVNELLLRKICIPNENIHRIKGELSQEEAVFEYKNELLNYFSGSDVGFDLVILGFGEDGHTGALFPGSKEICDVRSLILPTEGTYEDRPSKRITLGLRALNHSRNVIVLGTGVSKAGIVKKVFLEKDSELPVSKISPSEGRVMWLLDKDAARFLPDRFLSKSSCWNP
ncbi:MAG: 6-phosphogluconolactonase [Kosmotogaceae bacterium]|nr:6-phosphogluconolactonase [Kosmotogaceae bacterium]